VIVQSDDDLYRVDRVYLGPKGRVWPLRANYRAYVLWVALGVTAIVVWRAVCLPSPFVVVCALGVGTYFAAVRLERWLSDDRSVLSEVARVFQELGSPRPDLRPSPEAWSHRIDVARWRHGSQPRPRLWRRAAASAGGLAGGLGRRKGRVLDRGRWRNVA